MVINITRAKDKKDKKLLVQQYLYKIMPYLSDLINDHKTIRNNSNGWKIQINMHVSFTCSNVQEKFVLFLCGVIIKKIGQVMKQMTLLKDFLILS